MALSQSHKVGKTVGNVYAWGALGSIIGTFLGGFVLIDTLGTRAIVALVAGTLAAMGFLSAGSQWAFRSAVLFGWMQFVTMVGLVAAVTDVGVRDIAAWLAGETPSTNDPFEQGDYGRPWSKYGKRLGGQLHALGLTLGLREDQPGEYHDESNYSYINVTQTTTNGERVTVLKLDKLIHSYFVLDNPTGAELRLRKSLRGGHRASGRDVGPLDDGVVGRRASRDRAVSASERRSPRPSPIGRGSR